MNRNAVGRCRRNCRASVHIAQLSLPLWCAAFGYTPDDDAGQISATCRRAFGLVLARPKLDLHCLTVSNAFGISLKNGASFGRFALYQATTINNAVLSRSAVISTIIHTPLHPTCFGAMPTDARCLQPPTSLKVNRPNHKLVSTWRRWPVPSRGRTPPNLRPALGVLSNIS